MLNWEIRNTWDNAALSERIAEFLSGYLALNNHKQAELLVVERRNGVRIGLLEQVSSNDFEAITTQASHFVEQVGLVNPEDEAHEGFYDYGPEVRRLVVRPGEWEEE